MKAYCLKATFQGQDYSLQPIVKLSLVTNTLAFLEYQLPKNLHEMPNVPKDKRMVVFKTTVKLKNKQL